MNSATTSYALPVSPPQQSIGQVVNQLNDGSLVVECEGRGWHCRRAASCLISPETGDRVLIAGAGNELWLLAVLERAEAQQPALISVEGDLQIAPTGTLNLHSQQLKVTAQSGDCHIEAMNYSGKSFTAWLSLSRIVGDQCESVWQTVTQLSRTLLRRTQKTEIVRAGQLDMQAEDYLRAHAQNTFITAKGITKVDSEQIHMG